MVKQLKSQAVHYLVQQFLQMSLDEENKMCDLRSRWCLTSLFFVSLSRRAAFCKSQLRSIANDYDWASLPKLWSFWWCFRTEGEVWCFVTLFKNAWVQLPTGARCNLHTYSSRNWIVMPSKTWDSSISIRRQICGEKMKAMPWKNLLLAKFFSAWKWEENFIILGSTFHSC